jgi:hypothetical protein
MALQRGPKAMENQRTKQSQQKYTSFCPEIRWLEGDKRYIMFLNRIDYIPTVELHEFIPVGDGITKAGKRYIRYEKFIDRRDPCIGEDADDLTDRLGHQPRRKTMAIAVELLPVTKKVQGRDKPVSFTVKVEEFTRTTEDGNEEEVWAPRVGVVTQSKANFFGWFSSYDEATAPIESSAFQVVRRGGDRDTAYDVVPLELPIDLS